MPTSARAAQLGLAVEILAEKWRITVLHQLSSGSLRTTQLKNNLERISFKVLTETLRGLERDGLIERRVSPGVPPRVEYRLTGIAEHLLTALDSLSRWSESYGEQTLLARRRYDSRV